MNGQVKALQKQALLREKPERKKLQERREFTIMLERYNEFCRDIVIIISRI